MIHGLTRVWLSIVAAKIPSRNASPCFKRTLSESLSCQGHFLCGLVVLFCFSACFVVVFFHVKFYCTHAVVKKIMQISEFYVSDTDFLQFRVKTVHIKKSQNWMMFEHVEKKPFWIKVKTGVSDQDFLQANPNIEKDHRRRKMPVPSAKNLSFGSHGPVLFSFCRPKKQKRGDNVDDAPPPRFLGAILCFCSAREWLKMPEKSSWAVFDTL